MVRPATHKPPPKTKDDGMSEFYMALKPPGVNVKTKGDSVKKDGKTKVDSRPVATDALAALRAQEKRKDPKTIGQFDQKAVGRSGPDSQTVRETVKKWDKKAGLTVKDFKDGKGKPKAAHGRKSPPKGSKTPEPPESKVRKETWQLGPVTVIKNPKV